MNGTLLVRGARQLLTLRGPAGPRRGSAARELSIIEDGAVLVREGIIQEVGPSRRLENLAEARSARVIDASGRVVMPAFVDSHTHLAFDRPALDSFEARLVKARGTDQGPGDTEPEPVSDQLAAVSAQRLQVRARRIIGGMVRHGTTTVEAKSPCRVSASLQFKVLRVLKSLDRDPIDVVPTYLGPPQFASDLAQDLETRRSWLAAEHLPKMCQKGLARFADIAIPAGGRICDTSRAYLHAAQSLGLPLKFHAEQFGPDGAARVAVEFCSVSVDHLNYLDGEGIRLLARSDAIATLIPGNVFHLGLDRFPPARQLIDEGAAVALATGFSAHDSPTYSMPLVVAMACAQLHMTPAEAIAATTINAACALRLGHQAGSIEPGKDADLLLLNASDYREIPYYFGVNPVYQTIKRGEILYEEGSISKREADWPNGDLSSA